MKFYKVAWISVPSCLIVLVDFGQAQSISANFLFLAGDSSNPSTGVYPPNGPLNPGSRIGHRIAVYNGQVYLFQGEREFGNDAWAFNVVDKSWTWLRSNSNLDTISYGLKGTASPTTTPGYRSRFAGDLHRARREFILYGGGYSNDNKFADLWSYDLVMNTWKWVAGPSGFNQRAVYPPFGTATTLANPGAREGPSGVVYDQTGEFLMFGGQRLSFLFGDMWAFDFTTSKWMWFSGTSSNVEDHIFPAKRVWSTAHSPNVRTSSQLVVDHISNIVYLFGGYTGLYQNDMWGFKRASREWAFFGGGIEGNFPPSFGVRGLPAASNLPGSRFAHSMAFHAQSGLILMHGGDGVDSVGNEGILGDFWAWNTSSYEWTWIAGSSIYTSFGDYSSGDSAVPSATWLGDMTADRQTGVIYMYGGFGTITLQWEPPLDHMWMVNINALSIGLSNSISPAPSSELATNSKIDSSLAAGTSTLTSNLLDSPEAATSSIFTESSTIDNSVTAISRNLFGSSEAGYPNSSLDATSNFFFVIGVASAVVSTKSSSRSFDLIRPVVGEGFKIKYRLNFLVVGACIFLLTVLFLWILCLNSRKKRKLPTSSLREDQRSASTTSFEGGSLSNTSSTFHTTASSAGQSTQVPTTIGLYLPGGLQVHALNAYILEKELARGGGGSAWIAKVIDSNLMTYGKKVVVKIPNGSMEIERNLALFRQEISLMHAFQKHPNIVKMLGFSEDPHAIILKYYSLGTLTKWIEGGNRKLTSACLLIRDVSCGLLALHENGIVHCDVKPDNVLIDKGTRLFAVLTDFGIARIVTEETLKVAAYQVQRINGFSTAYAAPEVLDGKKLRKIKDSNAAVVMARDVYSMAIVINCCLNGIKGWFANDTKRKEELSHGIDTSKMQNSILI